MRGDSTREHRVRPLPARSYVFFGKSVTVMSKREDRDVRASSCHLYVGRCWGKRGKEGRRSVANRRSLHPLSNSYIRYVHSEKREDARSQKLRTSSRFANERNGGSWLDKKKRQRTENYERSQRFRTRQALSRTSEKRRLDKKKENWERKVPLALYSLEKEVRLSLYRVTPAPQLQGVLYYSLLERETTIYSYLARESTLSTTS